MNQDHFVKALVLFHENITRKVVRVMWCSHISPSCAFSVIAASSLLLCVCVCVWKGDVALGALLLLYVMLSRLGSDSSGVMWYVKINKRQHRKVSLWLYERLVQIHTVDCCIPRSRVCLTSSWHRAEQSSVSAYRRLPADSRQMLSHDSCRGENGLYAHTQKGLRDHGWVSQVSMRTELV